MASPSEAPAIPLVDAPKPWLVQFILTANPADYAALLLCCKPIQDLVRSTVKPAQLSIRPGQTEPLPQMVQACKPVVVIQLTVQGRTDGFRRRRALGCAINPTEMEPVQRELDERCWDVNTKFLQQLCSEASAATRPCCTGVPLLLHITNLTLQGDIKGAIIPSCIALACPNLRHFTRPGSFKDLSSGPDGAPVCSHLHTLHFTVVDITAPSPSDMNAAQQQLHLTTIKTLKLGALLGHYPRSSWWAHLLEPLHRHVTCLHLDGLWSVSPVGKELSSTWQAVRRVHLTRAVGPDDVRCLQQALPHLTQLGVASFVEGDYSSCRGSWKQVQLSIRDPHPMTIIQLGYLPLSWVGTLCFSSLEIAAIGTEHVVRASRNLTAHNNTVRVMPLAAREPLDVTITAPAALLPAAVSFLQLLQPTYLSVTMPAHTLLPPAHVLKGPSSMGVQGSSSLLLPVGYSLFKELPHMHMLELAFGKWDMINSGFLMAVLKAVCIEATGQAVLSLPEQAARELLGPTWKVRLGAAMMAAGHHHIWLMDHTHKPYSESCFFTE